MVQAESHDLVAWLNRGEIGGHVGLSSGVRLNICMIDSEEFFSAVNRQTFGDVNELASAIVAPSGVTFSVLVGHYRALGLQDSTTRIVL